MKFRTTSTEMISPKAKPTETNVNNLQMPEIQVQAVGLNDVSPVPNGIPNGIPTKPDPVDVMYNLPSMPVSPQTVKHVDSPTLGVESETPKASGTPISPISARTSFENRRASLKQKRASMDHRSSLDQRVMSAELQARLTVHEKQMRSFGEEFPADLIIPAEYLPKLPTNPKRDVTPTQADFPAKKTLWLDTSQPTSYDAPVSPDYAVKEEKPDKHLSSLSFIRFEDAPGDLALKTPETPSDSLSHVVSEEKSPVDSSLGSTGQSSHVEQLDSPTVPAETFRIQVTPPKRQSLHEPYTPSTMVDKRKQRASLLGNLGLGMKSPAHKRAATDLAAYETEPNPEPREPPKEPPREPSRELPKADPPQRAATVLVPEKPEKGKKRRFSGLSSLISRATPRRQSSSKNTSSATPFTTRLESTPEHPQPAQFEKQDKPRRPLFPPRKSSRDQLREMAQQRVPSQPQPERSNRRQSRDAEPNKSNRDQLRQIGEQRVPDSQPQVEQSNGRHSRDARADSRRDKRQSYDGHVNTRHTQSARRRRQSSDASQPEIDYKSVYPPEFYARDPVQGYYSPTEEPTNEEAMTAYTSQSKITQDMQFPKPPSTVPTRNQLEMHPTNHKPSAIQIPPKEQTQPKSSSPGIPHQGPTAQSPRRLTTPAQRLLTQMRQPEPDTDAPPPPPPKDLPKMSQQAQYEARLRSRQKVSTITTTTTTTTRHGARLSQGSIQSPKSIRSQNRASLPPLQTKLNLGSAPVEARPDRRMVHSEEMTTRAPTITTSTKSSAKEPVKQPEAKLEPEPERVERKESKPERVERTEPTRLSIAKDAERTKERNGVESAEPSRSDVVRDAGHLEDPGNVERVKPDLESTSSKQPETKRASQQRSSLEPPVTQPRAPSPVEKMKDEPRALEEKKEDDSDEEIVMSSTAYPGQEWRPDYGYGGWEGD